jgi:hypothetical protein
MVYTNYGFGIRYTCYACIVNSREFCLKLGNPCKRCEVFDNSKLRNEGVNASG